MEGLTKEVGEKLKHLREQKGYSLRDVSERTGIHFTYISKLEKGQHKANLEMIEKLCNFYDVTISSLFGDGVDVPSELKDIGVEWITFANDMKKKDLSPDEIRKIVEFANFMKNL